MVDWPVLRRVARTVVVAGVLVSGLAGCGGASENGEFPPPDLDRLAQQRAVVDAAARSRYGTGLTGGLEDLTVLQRLVDDQVFGPAQTYELQSLGIVLGQVLAESSEFSWVTVEDEYGSDPALQYKETSILIFPLTMISKRVEEGQRVAIKDLFDSTFRYAAGLESAR